MLIQIRAGNRMAERKSDPVRGITYTYPDLYKSRVTT